MTKSLSAGLLRAFQQASQIRDAFFAGGPLPQIAITVYPPVLSGTGVSAKFEMNGQSVVAQAGTSVSPQAMSWPAGGGRSAVTLTYDPPVGNPAVLDKNGAWSFFRLLDAGAPTPRGDRLVATFVVGGRELQYQFSFGSRVMPYNLPALREFRCPAGI